MQTAAIGSGALHGRHRSEELENLVSHKKNTLPLYNSLPSIATPKTRLGYPGRLEVAR